MNRFASQRALVTGAASGIGRAIACALAAEGATLWLVDRNETGLAALEAEQPDRFHAVPCDIADRAAWRQTLGSLPPPHLLVNSAALSLSSDLTQVEDPAWEPTLATNLEGSKEACLHMARVMPDHGRILNITSVHGRLCERGSFAYGVIKAALDQLTRALAVELAGRGILVNALAPGFVDTPMSRATGVNELETPWFRDQYMATGRIPLRRAAQPEEIAHAALFFLSQSNSYITGQVVAIDGGLTLTL